MRKIIDGELVDLEKMEINELLNLKNKLKKEERELFFRIKDILEEINKGI